MPERKARALRKGAFGDPFEKPQGVQHEFKGKILRIDPVNLCRSASSRFDRMEVLPRAHEAHLAADAVLKGDFPMRSRARSEVVAEGPVIEIVPAAAASSRVARNLVAREALPGQKGFDEIPHFCRFVGVGEFLRKVLGKGRSGLDRELVAGEVRGSRLRRFVELFREALHRLAGKGVHEVEIEVLENIPRKADRLTSLSHVVNAPEAL